MSVPAGSGGGIRRFSRRHSYLVAVDSDGCVFDSMDTKQKACFHPEIIRQWGLGPVEAVLRECAEFVNLYSRTRGQNRYLSLLRTFELLRDRPEARRPEVHLPPVEALRAFVASGAPLTREGLAGAVRAGGDPELRRVLEWSVRVDEAVAERAQWMPPFPGAAEALADMGGRADLMVCSQTPEEALRREWRVHGLADRVGLIAGQETGSKAEQLRRAAGDRYGPERVLMVGDAVGDRDAADALGACFYPILPGSEAESWSRLRAEAFPRFLAGGYRGPYQAALAEAFEACLPVDPPWR